MTVKGVFSTRNLYVLLVTFGALSLVIAHYVLPIFFSSIFEFENIEIFGYKLDSQYAMTKLTTLEESQLIFPTDMWTKIFGTGEDAEWSDIGYVKVVYMGGWVLLCLYVVFYLFIFFRSHKFFFKIFSGASHDVLAKRWREVWKYIILSLTIMMLFSNIKNLYFLTRIYHELFIVVFSLAAGIYAHNARVSRNYTLNELK